MRAPVGGLFRHVQDLALEQSSRGHNVGLIADASSGDSLTENRLSNVAPRLAFGVHRISMTRNPSFRDLACVRETNRIARDLSIDIVHGHGAKGGLFARLTGTNPFYGWRGSTHRPKRFYTPHGGSLHYTDSLVKGMVFLGIEMVLDRFSDGLIFESQFARLAYEGALGESQASTRIIANGLRPGDFDSVPLRENAADFLFVGELRDLKGVDVLLRAFAALCEDRRQEPDLVVVGDGSERQSLTSLASELGISQRVTFPGALPIQDAFPMGKILVMPSRAESLPYIALEAAGAGRPLIATRVGGVPEIVWGTDTALVPPDDVDALKLAMQEALVNVELTQLRAKRLRESVKSRFTVDMMTSSVISFYEEALSDRVVTSV